MAEKIDVSKVQWDDPAIDPAQVKWDTPAASVAEASKPMSKPAQAALAGPDALLSLATGSIAAPVAGLAGLSAMAGNAMGGKYDPAQTVENVQQGMTYQPRTQYGRNITSVIAWPFEKLAKAADWTGEKVSDVTGSPAAGAAVNTAMQFAPALVAKRALPARQPVPLTPAQESAAAARAAGLRLTPEQAGGTLGKVAQGITGSAKLERSVSVKNAPRVNDLVKQELDIPRNQSVTPATIAESKKPANAVYDAVAKTGRIVTDDSWRETFANMKDRTGSGSFAFDTSPKVRRLIDQYAKVDEFSAEDAVAKVRQLRADSVKNIKAPNSPEQNALGYAQRKVADALDDQIDRHIQAGAFEGPDGAVDPALVSKYREARVKLAKAHTAEAALKGNNISARSLVRQQERGVPLSGNFKTIADAAKEFDRSFQDVSKIRNNSPFSVVDYLLGVGGATANPALAAAILARPTARGILASPLYQRLGIDAAARPTPIPATSALIPLLSEQTRSGLIANQQGLLAPPQQ